MTTDKILEDSEIMNLLLKELRFSALGFANELEYKSHSSIHHILNNKNKISDDLVTRTIKRFPEVSYLFMKKGKLPVLFSDKLARNQLNILVDGKKSNVDYNSEVFNILKDIDSKMGIIIEKLDNNK